MKKMHNVMNQRRAGVLLHPTSLPCGEEHWQIHKTQKFGTIGKEAYHFIDWMAEAGISVWQMLPTGPTLDDMSPYQSLSAHAGNPELISIEWLIEKNWVPRDQLPTDFSSSAELRKHCALLFFNFVKKEQGVNIANEFELFCKEQSYWLDDFAHYCAFREHFNLVSWNQWPEELRKHDPKSIKQFSKKLSTQVDSFKFEQFAFYSQWKSLHNYAKEKSIVFFGDIPIFVGHDSADVWGNQSQFLLDESGAPITVAGVPPDYFSETGQHWGNPHYHWENMQRDGFVWWKNRLRTQLIGFDILRVDHFRAFEAYWAIPGDSHDARLGQWIKAPGKELLKACFDEWPNLPLVAENLGVITDEVEALRHEFNLPGMLVLQFAYDGNAKNPHLSQHHTMDNVIYTGTHDNDTTKSWYENLAPSQQKIVQNYLLSSSIPMPWLLIEVALASTGLMSVIPMQDFLELDGAHRMNMPGTQGQNWQWKFRWEMVAPDLAKKIRTLISQYDRLT
jgi:4-alpha-glucanotransferase